VLRQNHNVSWVFAVERRWPSRIRPIAKTTDIARCFMALLNEATIDVCAGDADLGL
jgi:hypothetical protein